MDCIGRPEDIHSMGRLTSFQVSSFVRSSQSRLDIMLISKPSPASPARCCWPSTTSSLAAAACRSCRQATRSAFAERLRLLVCKQQSGGSSLSEEVVVQVLFQAADVGVLFLFWLNKNIIPGPVSCLEVP